MNIPQEIKDLYMDLAFSRTSSSGAVVLALSPGAAHELETLIADIYPQIAVEIDMHRRESARCSASGRPHGWAVQ